MIFGVLKILRKFVMRVRKMVFLKRKLLERQLCLGEKISDLDQKHKEWSKKLSG
jgi:hypothetical protein